MNLSKAVESFLAHRRARNLSPATLQQYTRHLDDWRRHTNTPDDLADVQLKHLDSFFAYLAGEHLAHGHNPHRPAAQRGLSPATLAAYRRTLKAFWRFSERRGWLRSEQLTYFYADGVPIPYVPEVAREACDEHTLERLARACGDVDNEEAARNRAVLWLLFESGMRVSELCSLDNDSLELRERRALITGKGRRKEYVFFGSRAVADVLAYWRVRSGERGGALFRGTNSRNRGRLTSDGVRSLIRRVADVAGVTLPYGSPVHWIRRGFIQHCLDAGLDLVEVQQLARHKDVKTTMLYAKRQTGRLQRAHGRTFGDSQ
jgi:site-specific recombinase XerD